MNTIFLSQFNKGVGAYPYIRKNASLASKNAMYIADIGINHLNELVFIFFFSFSDSSNILSINTEASN